MTKTWMANDIFYLSDVQGNVMQNLALVSLSELFSPLFAKLSLWNSKIG